jgi:serine phosphatase RsbU (regulator of sigma subunit)
MSQSIADFRIRSMMCAPLLDAAGEAFGVLQIDTLDQRQRFQPDDLELLASAASQAAIAIQNAQLYEQTLKNKEVERDMQLAREVQRGFLPDSRPTIGGYSFFDYYQPADQVGGDYYDYIPLADGRLAVVVADVVGHGVAAALLMAKLSAETRFCLYTEADPATAVTRINERLVQTGLSRFVTMIMLVLDAKNHKATIVNAGHMAPLHRNGKSLAEPGNDIAGLPLGIVDSIPYQQMEIEVSPGDILVLYTDGINETMDAEGKFYGIDRMRKFMLAKPHAPLDLGTQMVQDVRTFLGEAVQNDDMCLVCVGRD